MLRKLSTSTSITLSVFGFELTVVPITTSVDCSIAIGTKLAGDVLKNEEEYYSEKFTFSRNTVQDFLKGTKNSSEKKK